MGIIAPKAPHHQNPFQFNIDNKRNQLSISMSQDYHHQGIFNFSNGFERSQQDQQQQQQQQHIAQQIRRDKLRIQGFDPPPPLVGIHDEESSALHVSSYEPAGMLSEMFGFPTGGGTATELLENQILQSYRNNNNNPRAAPPDWYPHRQGMAAGGDSMQLFLMNPHQQQRSPSPSPSNNPATQSTSSTLHMLLPNPNSSSYGGQFTWGSDGNNPSEIPAVVEGLSLSLSSSLEAAKAEEMRMGDGGMMFFGGSTQPPAAQYQFKNLGGGGGGALHLQGGGSSSAFGTVSMLRNSKYAKAAQELLEEFCSVGRGQFKKNTNKFQRPANNNNNDGNGNGNTSSSSAAGAGGGKDIPSLSAADRLEHQRRKVKLLSMLDEVDRRYNHYCEQMQMVVNSFDMVMGFGAAVPYTCLAQKAMSRHFRCLKDAIAAQLKHSCELLGEKDAGTSGVTKGETPRLRILEQSLRQQRAFHQMGMMEQEAWRPQRGLPERSVNILRAWLFEHFLHPYPSDADKHLLARQTGLSRNQVSNWFINARVRLWKPMVEEMYQQEAKDDSANEQSSGSAQTPTPNNNNNIAPPPPTTTTSSAATTAAINTIPPPPQFNENDPSLMAINRQQQQQQCFSESAPEHSFPAMRDQNDVGATLIRFGTSAGDVSLTLGLRHAGNMPEKSPFSVRDFGGC